MRKRRGRALPFCFAPCGAAARVLPPGTVGFIINTECAKEVAALSALTKPYPSVQLNSRASFGGSQQSLDTKTLRRCGCGLVAVLDLLLYLSRTPAEPMPLEQYRQMAHRLRRRFPLVYPFGTSGPVMALCLGLLLRRLGLPLRARWGVKWPQLWEKMAEMLEADLPVILAVGQNFPLPWGNHKLAFYRLGEDGQYRFAGRTKAHFVTVTGLGPQWMEVSSWGERYYLSRTEYEAYTRRHSCRWFSNILYLSPKSRRNRP